MNVKKLLGLAAVGALLTAVAPAQAASPVNPGAAATAQDSKTMTTEVRWDHHHWRRHWHPHRHWHRYHHWHHGHR